MPSNDGLLDHNTPVLGASCTLHSKPTIEIFADAGLDYAFLDFEHTGPSIWDSHALEEYVRTAEDTPIELLVRIPSGDPQCLAGLVRRVLDTGVRNVVVPRVRTTAEVEAVVAAASFDRGERGVPASRGSRWGATLNPDWIRHEDETANVGVMIENADAVANLEEWVDIDGLSFVLLGPMDLSVDLGTPTDLDDPEVIEAIDRVVDVCANNDVPFGLLGGDLQTGTDIVDRGGTFLHVGSSVGFLRDGVREAVDNAKQ